MARMIALLGFWALIVVAMACLLGLAIGDVFARILMVLVGAV